MDSTDALTRDLIPFLGNVAQMLDEMKVERERNWTSYSRGTFAVSRNGVRQKTLTRRSGSMPSKQPTHSNPPNQR
jgi:hypothetical protein